MDEKDNYVKLLKDLLYIRLTEEKIADLYKEQKMRCPVHLSIGQESCAVCICNNLSPEDHMYSNHRSHAHYLGKGGDLKKFFSELYGKKEGCTQGFGGSMHLIDLSVNFMGATPIVGGTIPVAVGDAFEAKYNEKERISVLFIGDGATEEGVFYESLNFAQLHSLPILFVCENNEYAVYTNKTKRRDHQIIKIPKSMEIETKICNGYDIYETLKISKEIIDYIKKEKKPGFIQINTYRWREHCGPNFDNDIGYRKEEEYLEWKKKDPIKKLSDDLIEKKIITSKDIDKIKEEIKQKLDLAVKFAKNSDNPKKNSVFKNIYA